MSLGRGISQHTQSLWRKEKKIWGVCDDLEMCLLHNSPVSSSPYADPVSQFNQRSLRNVLFVSHIGYAVGWRTRSLPWFSKSALYRNNKALLVRISEVAASDIERMTSHRDSSFRGFPQYIQEICRSHINLPTTASLCILPLDYSQINVSLEDL
jgi:hypothetical protein